MNDPLMPLAFDRLWRGTGWLTAATGGGIVSESDGILTCTGGAGAQAYRQLWIPAVPGMTLELECLARLVSGSGQISLDVLDHDITNIVITAERADFSGDDWNRYRVTYTVPYSASITARFIRTFWGVPVGPGDVRLQFPAVRIGRTDGAPLVVARGLVRLVSGVVSVLSTTMNMGIASVAFDGATKVTVTLTHAILGGPGPNLKPILKLTPSGNHWFVPICSAFTGGAAPFFDVKWTNGAAIQNVSAIAQVLEFFFEVTF